MFRHTDNFHHLIKKLKRVTNNRSYEMHPSMFGGYQWVLNDDLPLNFPRRGEINKMVPKPPSKGKSGAVGSVRRRPERAGHNLDFEGGLCVASKVSGRSLVMQIMRIMHLIFIIMSVITGILRNSRVTNNRSYGMFTAITT